MKNNRWPKTVRAFVLTLFLLGNLALAGALVSEIRAHQVETDCPLGAPFCSCTGWSCGPGAGSQPCEDNDDCP